MKILKRAERAGEGSAHIGADIRARADTRTRKKVTSEESENRTSMAAQSAFGFLAIKM